MRTNWKKGQTTGFRAAALFAVLGATLVWAHAPEAYAPGDAVPLEEVVLVTKVAADKPTKTGGPLGLLGGLLGDVVREHAGEDVGREALQVAHAHALERPADPLPDRVRAGVGRAVEPEPQVLPRVLGHLAPRPPPDVGVDREQCEGPVRDHVRRVGGEQPLRDLVEHVDPAVRVGVAQPGREAAGSGAGDV